MDLLRRLVDFYRVQVELVWHWRRGRRQLIWRAIVSFFVAAFSLAVTAFLLPGVRVDNVFSLAAAVIAIGALSALVRPVLLAIVAPLSLVLMLLTALVFQVAVIPRTRPARAGHPSQRRNRCALRRGRFRRHQLDAQLAAQPRHGRLVLLDARPPPPDTTPRRDSLD